MRLLLWGFDGLDSLLFEETDLPFLSHLRETAQWGTLWSREMRTAPCWTTILTGWKIESHGITHLLGYPYENSSWFGEQPHDYIFDEFGRVGMSVGVINFPSLLMPREIVTRGQMNDDVGCNYIVAGWPGRPCGVEKELLEDFYSDLPDYEERALISRRPAGAQKDWAIHEIPWNEYIDWVTSNSFKVFDIINRLPKVDALMIQNSVMDRAGHMLSTPNKGRQGADDERYIEALRLVNDLLEDSVERYKPQYLSVVSDHGFQGADEAASDKGCWHSKRGVWALRGHDVLTIRNNMAQQDFTPTVLDCFGIDVERDGQSMLIRESDMEQVGNRLGGLGYE